MVKDIQFSELCLLMLRRLSDVLLPSETELALSEIIPLCVALCNPKQNLLFCYRPAMKQKVGAADWSPIFVYFTNFLKL